MTARPVYMMVTGPFRNVGDTVIRKLGIRWVRSIGEPHLYLGTGREAWVRDLHLETADVPYEHVSTWLASFICNLSKRPILVVEPGEFSLTRPFYQWAAVHSALGLLARFFGGDVIQLPRAIARQTRFGRALYTPLIASATAALWRRDISFRGKQNVLVPDIAFCEKPTYRTESNARSLVVLSIRGDLPLPGIDVLHRILSVVKSEGCSIVVTAQVEMDNDRAREIAGHVGGEAITWDENVSSTDHENIVRGLYARSKIVLSDRLHVLVMALTEGATPVGFGSSGAPKASQHFAAAGVPLPIIAALNSEGLETVLKNALTIEGRPESQTARARATILHTLDAKRRKLIENAS